MSVPLRLGIILLLACCVATLKVITCENGRTFLYCGTEPGRYGLINVTSANYGRTDNSTCIIARPTSQVTTTTCFQPNTLSEVSRRCEGKTQCLFLANNKVFGNPCPGTYKYLKVTYTCVPPPVLSRRLIQCEGRFAVPWCPFGVIRIDSAIYGRRSRRICDSRRPRWQVRNTRCVSDVTSIMAPRCDGNQRCSNAVGSSVFGSPCRGTYKYLDVKYSCLS